MKSNILKILISFLLLIFIFYKVDFSRVYLLLKEVNFGIYLVVIFIFFINQALSSYKWKLLIDSQGINISFFKLYKYYLFGTVSNLFLPTSIGGDLIKSFALLKKEKKDSKSPVFFATISDRLTGFIALSFYVVFFSFLNNNAYNEMGLGVSDLLRFAIFIAVLFFIMAAIFYLIYEKNEKFRVFLAEYNSCLKIFLKNKNKVATVFIISFVFHFISVFNSYLLFMCLGSVISLQFLFFAIPLNRLIVSVPVSYGGLGLNELSLIKIFSIIGIAPEILVSYSLLGYANIVFLLAVLLVYIAVRRIINLKFFHKL